ncbi:MAG: hypothetical protein HY540_01125 [Deltaproteobacteria bacterium]|nr:hypothetical protein [Deltaproteobacteria bacterium]
MRKSMSGLCLIAIAFTVACGSSGSDTTGNSSCAAGSNDFYVVESACSTANAGKLVRVNPDAACKDTILSSLDCPVALVLESNGTGYLSEVTQTASKPTGQEQPGNIYYIDVNNKTKTLVNDGRNRVFMAPKALFLGQISSEDTSKGLGCTNGTSRILFVADEGNDTSGTVWKWCLDTANLTGSPEPIAEISSDQTAMINPRGIETLDGKYLLVTARSADGTQGILVRKEIGLAGSTAIVSFENNFFTNNLKFIIKDTNTADTNFLIVDAGDGTVSRYDTTAGTARALQNNLDGPRDALPIGDGYYLVSLFGGNQVVKTKLNGDTPTNVATGLTFDAPENIAQISN